MGLKEFCYDVLIEMRKEQEYNIDDVVEYVVERARKHLDGKNGGIDDSTIKQWVMEYDPSKKVKEEVPEVEVKAPTVKPAPKKDKFEPSKKEISGSWGTMESLF